MEDTIMPSPDPFEIHAEMRAFAKRNLEQVKFAFDKFIEAARAAIISFEWQSEVAQAGAKKARKIVTKLVEQNVTTAFDYARKLVRAKDPEALLALHGDMNAQMRMFRDQVTTVRAIASGGILLSAWYRPNRGHSGMPALSI
jgi:hypothetical protein